MSSSALSGILFACVLGSSLIVMFVRRFLPEHHLNAESKEIVKTGMGLIATMSALVLGLLIATAKGTYDAQSGVINELTGSYILLDRVLLRYGPETKEARDLLRTHVVGTHERLWPKEGAANLAPNADPKATIELVYAKVGELTPKTESQRELRGRVLGIMTDIGQARLRLYARQDSSLPAPLLVVLVFWLIILFAGYGLFAPGNLTVIAMLGVCALSVSGAVFLILELATPFAGVMRISDGPVLNALSLMGQ